MVPPVPPKGRVVSIKSNGYYVACNNKYKNEHEEIFSEILGEDIDKKINLSRKLRGKQPDQENKLEEYENFASADTIEKVFNELHKRLSTNSKQIMAQYQTPDYKKLSDKNVNIDLKLDPQPLQPSFDLNFKKTDFFRNKNEIKRLNNQIEKEAEQRITELIEKFPKAKTNTALLQYAHKLSREFLRNKYLEQKHQEFLAKNEVLKVKQNTTLENIKSKENPATGGLNISLKHPYNRKFKAGNDSFKMDAHKYMENTSQPGDDTEINKNGVKTVDVKVKSRTASLCYDDSKCGTVKIGPVRRSLIDGTTTAAAASSNETTVTGTGLSTIAGSPNVSAKVPVPTATPMAMANGALNANVSGGTMDSGRPNLHVSTLRTIPEQMRMMRHTYRGSYNHMATSYGNFPMSASSTGSFDRSHRSLAYQSKAIRYSQLCLASEKIEKPKTSGEFNDTISFLKNQIATVDPLSNLNSPVTPIRGSTMSLPPLKTDFKPTSKLADSTSSTPTTAMSSQTLPTPASTVPTSAIPSSASTLSINSPRRENMLKKPVAKNPPKRQARSKLSESISADELYKDLVECEIEDESKAKEISSKLEPIVEVASIAEKRKSTTLKGAEAELFLTTVNSLENAEKSREYGINEMNKRMSIKSQKKLPIISESSVPAVAATAAASNNTSIASKDNAPSLAAAPMIESKSKLSIFKRARSKSKSKVKALPTKIDDEYADVNSYDSLIDLLTVESIAGTIENKDFLNVGDDTMRRFSKTSKTSRSTTIRKNSALGIIMQGDNESETETSDSETDSNSSYFTNNGSSPNTIASDFSNDEVSDIETQVDYASLIGAKNKVPDSKYLKPFNKTKRNTAMSALTEYNFFTEEDIKLIFDDEKFDQDFITFSRKRQSFDIFETYMMALAKMKV